MAEGVEVAPGDAEAVVEAAAEDAVEDAAGSSSGALEQPARRVAIAARVRREVSLGTG